MLKTKPRVLGTKLDITGTGTPHFFKVAKREVDKELQMLTTNKKLEGLEKMARLSLIDQVGPEIENDYANDRFSHWMKQTAKRLKDVILPQHSFLMFAFLALYHNSDKEAFPEFQNHNVDGVDKTDFAEKAVTSRSFSVFMKAFETDSILSRYLLHQHSTIKKHLMETFLVFGNPSASGRYHDKIRIPSDFKNAASLLYHMLKFMGNHQCIFWTISTSRWTATDVWKEYNRSGPKWQERIPPEDLLKNNRPDDSENKHLRNYATFVAIVKFIHYELQPWVTKSDLNYRVISTTESIWRCTSKQ
eukprot:CAMPEP_0172475462 /NCGR_PEP_ID=MMETSP1065-20121228/69885_1 /TAXON_ID=265537 /ORGANISM="Amphiprora paludosa, Strain CCMP125" /LENGTH=302 /DNA_ID=CAMNT_0013233667 /DNA_START=261 /DNA_END=1169 /DNA_ORIENTATION=+